MTAEWSVIHVGIGRLRYASEAEAIVAAGNCGRVQTRSDPDEPWQDADMPAAVERQLAEVAR